MNTEQGWQAILIAFFITAGAGAIGSTAHADPELTLTKYLQSVKIGGDYRLRYDKMHFNTPPSGTSRDRDRFRSRLRLGFDFLFPNRFAVKTRFASGTGEQTSTNQTFTNNGSQKALWIDRAYLDWVALDSLELQAGRMENPMWRLYSSDAVWDDDYSPEGAGEKFSKLFGNVNVFANALQMVVNEVKSSPNDYYLFTEQVGAEFKLPFESRIKLGYAYHDWKNERINTSSGTANLTGGVEPPSKSQEGNRKNGGYVLNEFGVSEVTAELSSWIMNIPLSIQGTFLENHRAKETASSTVLNQNYNQRMNKGYQAGFIFGKAKEAKTWEAAYFYKRVEADATISDVADSDFGDGGTNRVGHIMRVAYSPVEWMTLQAKYFMTQPIERRLSPNGNINRLQVDTSVRF